MENELVLDTSGSIDTITVTNNPVRPANTVAVEVSHHEVDVKWVIPTPEDLKQCSDEELRNIATFSTLSGAVTKAKDFLAFANRMLPERFKVNKPV